MVTNSGDLDSATVYYYNKNQIIETRDGSDNLETQVYHGTRYIDEIVGMRLPQGRVYLHQDANYNVIAMTDLTGRELERYHYTPYGELEVSVESHMFDYDDDGDVDENDIAAGTSSGVCWGNYSGDCMRLDADCDEDIDIDDYNAIVAYVDTLSSDTEVQRVPSTTSSKLGNMLGHQGLVFDAEIGSYQNRARQYAPKAKRFMQRDPLALRPSAQSGYQDGLSTYGYVRAQPLLERDPLGLALHDSCFQNCYIYSDPNAFDTCMSVCMEFLGSVDISMGTPACLCCAKLREPRGRANSALEDWKNRTGSTDACRNDAMQHCIGAAMLAGDCGSQCAVAAGAALEIYHLITASEIEGNDLVNNQQGAHLCGAAADAVSCCEKALNHGLLATSGGSCH